MRIRTNAHDDKKTTITSLNIFAANLFSTVLSNAQNALSKLQNKIEKEAKISVFVIKHKVKQSQEPLTQIQKVEKIVKRQKNSLPQLTEEQKNRLKEIDKRKLQLFERLKKIQSQIKNENSLSRIARSKISLNNSQYKITENDSIPERQKHNRALGLLAKLQEQKNQRQQKQISRMKKQQDMQMDKLKITRSVKNQEVTSKYSELSKNTLYTQAKVIDSLDHQQHKYLSQFQPQEQIVEEQ